MQVKIDKTFQVEEVIDKVWKFLSDPNKVVTCIPGAKITEAIDDQTFKGAVSMKVGPIVTNYNGEVKIERFDDTIHEVEIVGKGKDAKGRGSATMKMMGHLHQLAEGGTEIENSMEINITGKLAQFGSRMIEDVSGRMFEQFTQNFEKNLMNPEIAVTPDDVSEPIKAIPLISSAVKSTITGLFKGKDKKEKDDS